MLFLAGLMGMVLVGTTVYVNTGEGLDDAGSDDEAAIDEYSGQPMVSLGEVIGGTPRMNRSAAAMALTI